MSTEENKAIVLRWFEESFNKGNLAAMDECVAPDYVDHIIPPPATPGVTSFKRRTAALRAAFPDLQFTVEVLLAEADLVAFHWTARGTHRGTFAGVPPTGKQITFTGLNMERIANGKIIENWTEFDLLNPMREMGAI